MSRWNPILPLPRTVQELSFPAIDRLALTLQAAKAKAEAHRQAVAVVLERIKREFAVHTGLLERLYTLDRGTTELLIEHGLSSEHVEDNSTNLEPDDLVAILHSQRDGVDLVFSWVIGAVPLTTSGIKQLHSILTRDQLTTDAVDQFGHRFSAPLLHGAWKNRPNNPRRPDGSVHEYCPPEHVASEIESLLRLFHSYRDVHPIVQAAWLHHRFAQIHPFQDGNGRVARCIMTFALIRGDLVPVVIRDEKRTAYIDALEAADDNDLMPLIYLLRDDLERQMVSIAGMLRPQREHLPRTPLEAAMGVAERIAAPRPRAVLELVDLKEWLDASFHKPDWGEATAAKLNAPFVAKGLGERFVWRAIDYSESNRPFDRRAVIANWNVPAIQQIIRRRLDDAISLVEQQPTAVNVDIDQMREAFETFVASIADGPNESVLKLLAAEHSDKPTWEWSLVTSALDKFERHVRASNWGSPLDSELLPKHWWCIEGLAEDDEGDVCLGVLLVHLAMLGTPGTSLSERMPVLMGAMVRANYDETFTFEAMVENPRFFPMPMSVGDTMERALDFLDRAASQFVHAYERWLED